MRYSVNIDHGQAVRYGYQWFNTDNDIREAEPMQFTGLHDKNGVEIYEGDIVRSKGKPLSKVVFSKKAAKFCIQSYRMNPYNKMTKRVYSILSCEVVGNIYENPELLNRESLR